MLRQGNRSQTKEIEDKKQLDVKFKTTLIKFFKNFLEKANKINKTYEDMKRDQLEIKNTFSEIKNIITMVLNSISSHLFSSISFICDLFPCLLIFAASLSW